MDFLKDVFGDKPLTFDDFSKVVSEKGINIADLSTGGYVGKDKYSTDVNKFKTDYGTLKSKYDELAGQLDGDSGLKKQVETLTTERAEFENKFNEATSTLNSFKNSQSVLKNGVVSDMSDFVAFEVGKMTSETVDFDTALKGYLAKNPQFKADTKARVRTSPNMSGEDGAGSKTDVNSRMNNALLQASGRK